MQLKFIKVVKYLGTDVSLIKVYKCVWIMS